MNLNNVSLYGSYNNLPSKPVKPVDKNGISENAKVLGSGDEEKLTQTENALSKQKSAVDEMKMRLEQFKAEQENAKEQGKGILDLGKLLRIAAHIMNGDRVPDSDKKKLAEEMPDLYRQAEMMKRTDNMKPEKYKSEFEDEDEENDLPESESALEVSKAPESAPAPNIPDEIASIEE